MKQIQNFLSEELYKECISTARHLLTIPNNLFFTNYWWNEKIIKDSFPVLVHSIASESELYHKLKSEIENKTGYYINSNELMFYYWTRYSYIPWHDDPHCDAALTIYLNEEWEPDFGGYYIYEDEENDLRAVTPKPNLALLQKGGMRHTTTPVNFVGFMRITIQVFMYEKINKVKGENK
jgi:Rps23 Pro-64 3,4-dihydroxylase Tpa1-like proline 4-hydroxylase